MSVYHIAKNLFACLKVDLGYKKEPFHKWSRDKLWCIRKTVAYSIQNRLLYSLAKFKVRQLPKPELYSIFKGYSKWDVTLWTRCLWRCCVRTTLWKCFFAMLVMSICKNMLHCRSFTVHYLSFLHWEGSSYRRALFSSLNFNIDSRLLYCDFDYFGKCWCFVLLYYSSCKPYYIFERIIERI